MRPLSLFVIAIAGMITLPALAQSPSAANPPPTVRIRGTVDKLDGDTLTVKAKDGSMQTITVAHKSVQYFEKKNLADIKVGDFLASTGIKGTSGKIHAIEVRIFPKASPDGGRQFPWDLSPDSVMTNATVGQVTQTPNGPLLHVTFTGGESEYTIGPDVPILAGADGDKSLLQPGKAVFVIARKGDDGKLTSARIYVEKDGVKPPM
ncbi:MAG: hypothetical protein WAV02_18250 [Stellaceae bacterium]